MSDIVNFGMPSSNRHSQLWEQCRRSPFMPGGKQLKCGPLRITRTHRRRAARKLEIAATGEQNPLRSLEHSRGPVSLISFVEPKRYKWITDGSTNRRILEGEHPPDGWDFGMTIRNKNKKGK